MDPFYYLLIIFHIQHLTEGRVLLTSVPAVGAVLKTEVLLFRDSIKNVSKTNKQKKKKLKGGIESHVSATINFCPRGFPSTQIMVPTAIALIAIIHS